MSLIQSFRSGHPQISWCALFVMVMQILIACGPTEDHTDHDHNHGDAGGDIAQETTSENGIYRVRYSAEPEMIPLNEPFELHTEVTRVDGAQLADDIEVQIDAGMPSHNHGMNTSPMTMKMADGTFHTTGMLFHMEGRWEITVDVTSNDQTDRAIFQVDVTP